MLAAFLLTTTLLAPSCPTQEEWQTDTTVRLGKKARRHARARATRACRAMGATREACMVLDIIAVRESSGDNCAVHVLAADEYGIGLHGLFWKFHWAKWFEPQGLEQPGLPATEEFRIPEVSAVVALRNFRRAVYRYKATTWRDVGAVFAGCIYRNRACVNWPREKGWCDRLNHEGLSCQGDPTQQLGEKLGTGPTKGQREFVRDLQDRGSK